MCEAGTRSATDLLAAIDAWRSRPQPQLPPEQLADELIRLRHACDLLELEFSGVAADFAATDEYARQGSVSPIDWIRHSCRMSGHAAARSVCVGEQAERVPLSTEALASGDIGFGHLALLAGTARAVSASSGQAPFDEGPLLTQAREHSVGRFQYDCFHARHAADQAGFLQEHVEQVENRRLELLPVEGGGVALRGLFDPVGGAAIRSALEPLARRLEATDTRERRQRYADALVELAGHGLDEGVIPQRAGQRVHLQLTASVETLMARPGSPAGDLEFSPPVPAATVQRLACDSSVTRVLLGAESTVLDVGRARRVVSGPARRALNVRDRGCRWPGCERPPSWTAAHHVRHWADNGVTELPNLLLLCHRHHWLVHEGGWQLSLEHDQVETIPPRPSWAPVAIGSRPRAPAPANV